MATEELGFDVVAQYDGFELRRYHAHMLAEVRVKGGFDSAGNRAFGALFGYISGRNVSRQKIAMTAPVVQSAAPVSEKIAMTAPVVQQESDEGVYNIAFVLPDTYTAANAPDPTNPDVTIRAVPPRVMAVQTYSGSWSQSNYKRHEAELRKAIAAAGLSAVGTPIYARHNAPYTLWFLRRNEVLIEIAQTV